MMWFQFLHPEVQKLHTLMLLSMLQEQLST
jgi:hypothetical protein